MKNETGGAAAGPQTLGWLLRFWALAALFYWLDHAAWFKAVVVAPYARFSALVTAGILFLLGIECQIDGSILTLSGHSFVIADSCTGSYVFLLLAAVVIAFPASFKEKLAGLMAGFSAVVILNLLRTLMIVIVASKFTGSFWSLHIIVGQALMIAGTLGVFIWWAKGVGSGLPFLSPDLRHLFQLIALYAAGFIVSYILYGFFLNSPLGGWFQKVIVSHAAAVLSLFTDTVQHGQVISTARNSVKVIYNCLASPVLVLFFGAFFVLPIPWSKRIFLYLVSFFPLYYVYNIARIVAVVWFLPGGQNADFSHNFFSQLVVVSGLLAFSLYYWVGIRRMTTLRRHLPLVFTAVLCSAGITFLTGWLWQQLMLSPMFLAAAGSKGFYDPGRTVSLMPLFHIFPWLFLVMITPIWSLRQRVGRGFLGYLGITLFYVLLLALILWAGFAPHPRLIKAINIFPPFVVYYFMVRRSMESVTLDRQVD